MTKISDSSDYPRIYRYPVPSEQDGLVRLCLNHVVPPVASCFIGGTDWGVAEKYIVTVDGEVGCLGVAGTPDGRYSRFFTDEQQLISLGYQRVS